MDEIRLDRVSVSYGKAKALHDVTLSFKAGGVFTIVGPNGAGKSTLLATIAGLKRPTSGKLSFIVAGIDKQRIPRDHFGFCSQELMLYGSLTVRENLTLFGKLYGNIQVDSIAILSRKFSMVDSLDKVIDECSLGMKKKSSLIRALIHDPKLLILDEPFLGLDEVGKKSLLELLAEMKKEGCTIICATHEPEQFSSLSTQTVRLEEGKIYQL